MVNHPTNYRTPSPSHVTDNLNFPALNIPRYTPFDGLWRATECTGCPAAMIHRALGCPHANITSQTLAYFHEGYLHEADLKKRVRAKGVVLIEYGDTGIRALDAPVVGHPDDYSPVERQVYEYKSVGDQEEYRDAEQALYEQHSSWKKQIQAYMRITGATTARVIMKVRKTGWILKPWVVDYDASVTDPIWDAIEMAVSALEQAKANFAPGTALNCNQVSSFLTCSSDYMTRLFCPFHEVHCKQDRQKAAEALNKLIEDYAGCKMLFDEMDDEMKGLRTKIKALAEEATTGTGVKTINGPIAKITMYQSSYPSVNRELAKQLLDPMTYNQIFTQSHSDSMRITLNPAYRNSVKELLKDGSSTDNGS